MNYNVVYDEAYIAPGMIIYNEEFTQFMKFFPNINENNQSFTFLVSDNVKDNPREAFRKIDFTITKQTPFYPALKRFVERSKQDILYSLNRRVEGYNQLHLQETASGIQLSFIKDLTHSKNLQCNAMSLTIASMPLMMFYQELTNVQGQLDAKKVLEKMVNLKAN